MAFAGNNLAKRRASSFELAQQHHAFTTIGKMESPPVARNDISKMFPRLTTMPKEEKQKPLQPSTSEEDEQKLFDQFVLRISHEITSAPLSSETIEQQSNPIQRITNNVAMHVIHVQRSKCSFTRFGSGTNDIFLNKLVASLERITTQKDEPFTVQFCSPETVKFQRPMGDNAMLYCAFLVAFGEGTNAKRVHFSGEPFTCDMPLAALYSTQGRSNVFRIAAYVFPTHILCVVADAQRFLKMVESTVEHEKEVAKNTSKLMVTAQPAVISRVAGNIYQEMHWFLDGACRIRAFDQRVSPTRDLGGGAGGV
jgi:hypothetical protein